MNTEQKKETPVILTARQTAATGILPGRTLYRLIAEKKIPVFKSGRTMYINYTKLLEALESGEGRLWERGQ